MSYSSEVLSSLISSDGATLVGVVLDKSNSYYMKN